MLGYIISDKEKINIEEHEIQSFDILHKTDLNIFVVKNNKVLYKNNIIKTACFYGHVQVLEWFNKSGYEFKYLKWLILGASIYGQVQILEWVKNSGYDFKHTKWPINNASKFKRVEILEWFKNSGYKFKYDKNAINWASDNGHIQVLEWFKNSGYKFKYDKWAFVHKNIKILEFFKNRNVKKVIKWYKPLKFIKTLKYKTKNNYMKGYNKN